MLSPELRDRLLAVSTPLLADARVRLGLPESHLDPGIRPVGRFDRMVGTAVTVRLELVSDRESADLKLLSEAYESAAAAGFPVIVIQVPAELHAYGIVGEGAAIHARAHGFVGALVEGAARDTDELQAMQFPTFCRTIAPGYIVGKASAVALGEPVAVGGRTIHTGDIIVGDSDGVVAIAPQHLDEIVARAEAIRQWEHHVHARLAEGKGHREALAAAGPMP